MHNSDSTEQRIIEGIVIKQLKIKLGIEFNSGVVTLENANFQVDFYDKTKSIYGEIYAGIDKLKSGQTRKVGVDILKLLTIEKLLNKTITKYLVFTDKSIEMKFKSNSWYSKSIESFGIKTICIDLSDEQQNLIRKAKSRQYR